MIIASSHTATNFADTIVISLRTGTKVKLCTHKLSTCSNLTTLYLFRIHLVGVIIVH